VVRHPLYLSDFDFRKVGNSTSGGMRGRGELVFRKAKMGERTDPE